MHGHDLLDPWENTSDPFKAPHRLLIPKIFLVSFVASLLFALTDVTSDSYNVNQWPLIVFDKCPGDRPLLSE